jgi:hypothetical protein
MNRRRSEHLWLRKEADEETMKAKWRNQRLVCVDTSASTKVPKLRGRFKGMIT